MKKNNSNIKVQSGFTLVELLIALIASSFIFLGMSYILVANTEQIAFEDLKNDSKAFANYVVDDIESSIHKGTSIELIPPVTFIDGISIEIDGSTITYGNHDDYGYARDDGDGEGWKKIYNLYNTYDNGEKKFKIIKLKYYTPGRNSYKPVDNCTPHTICDSYLVELKISLYNSSGGYPLETYTIERYIFNSYLHTHQDA